MTTPVAEEQIGLFWSGSAGRRAAELHRKLLARVFGESSVFISTQFQAGAPWFATIRDKVARARVAVFFLTPDALESSWLPYECGLVAATKELSAIVPVHVGITQTLADERVPVLQPHHANRFGSMDSFRMLCFACATQMDAARGAAELAQTAGEAWAEHEDETRQLTNAAAKLTPHPYVGALKHAIGVNSTNFSFPNVISLFEQDFFLVGINHSHVLNLEDPRMLIALLNRVLEVPERRARFLISDMWNASVFACYEALVHGPIASATRDSFTQCYKKSDNRNFIETVIRKALGEDKLNQIIAENRLEIRTYPTILDTFWFLDAGTTYGKCQLSLANASDGPGRPVFFCGDEDEPTVFRYYYGLADAAFRGGTQLWPPKTSG